jgi:hypothetical protein
MKLSLVVGEEQLASLVDMHQMAIEEEVHQKRRGAS